MNHVALVKVIQSLRDIDYLLEHSVCVSGVSEGTHKGDPLRLWLRLDMSGQIPARHPLRHNLEGGECYTYKWDDVVVF